VRCSGFRPEHRGHDAQFVANAATFEQTDIDADMAASGREQFHSFPNPKAGDMRAGAELHPGGPNVNGARSLWPATIRLRTILDSRVDSFSAHTAVSVFY
jgi:hypothetical protein